MALSHSFTVALLQARSRPGEVAANVQAVLSAMRRAAAGGAQLVLLPEAFLTGYQLPLPPCGALELGGPAFETLRAEAARLGVALVATAFTQGPRGVRNTAVLYDEAGRQALAYHKVHTCAFSHESCLEPGEAFYTGVAQGVRLGVMICYDREYPESARLLMLQGAEIILVPNDCGSMRHRLNALSTRAYENMVGVAMANPPGPEAGCSCAFSPIVWDEEGRDQDNLLLKAPEQEEGLYYARFDLDALRAWRASEMMGNTFRRPAAYAPLLERRIEPPFLRAEQPPAPEDAVDQKGERDGLYL